MIHDFLIGKKVLVRTYSAGVHFGTLVEKDGQTILLKDSRRIWYWSGANTLSQVANDGSLDIMNCKIAMVLPIILLEQVIEIMPLSTKAEEILEGAEEWKR